LHGVSQDVGALVAYPKAFLRSRQWRSLRRGVGRRWI